MRSIAIELFLAVLVAGGPVHAGTHELEFASGGTPLRALLHTPDGGVADTVVIELHGNPGRALQPESWLVDPLLDRGIAVFRFNYRGLWGNDGSFHLTNAIGDLRAALSFLTETDALAARGVTPRRVVLFGYSFGTAVALVGAAGDERVDAIASLAPCDHGYFGNQFADPASPIRDFLDDVTARLFGADGPIRQDPAVFTDDLVGNADAFRFPPRARALRDTKLLFLVGLDDRVCVAEEHFFPVYRALADVAHPYLEAAILNMDHGMRPIGRDRIADRLARWVESSGRLAMSDVHGSDAWLEAFARSYTAAWNSGDPDRVAAHYGEHGSLSINGGDPAVGRAALADVARSFMTGFPDLVLTFEGLSFEDGRVRYHWRFRGTNSGPDGTGKTVDFGGYESWSFDDDGKVATSLGTFDEAEYRHQLEHGAGDR
jgi:nuclear transport factor 2 (NTF2) superfamily protein